MGWTEAVAAIAGVAVDVGVAASGVTGVDAGGSVEDAVVGDGTAVPVGVEIGDVAVEEVGEGAGGASVDASTGVPVAVGVGAARAAGVCVAVGVDGEPHATSAAASKMATTNASVRPPVLRKSATPS